MELVNDPEFRSISVVVTKLELLATKEAHFTSFSKRKLKPFRRVASGWSVRTNDRCLSWNSRCDSLGDKSFSNPQAPYDLPGGGMHDCQRSSTDPDVPEILTPAALLAMKTTPLRTSPGDFGHPPDIFNYQW